MENLVRKIFFWKGKKVLVTGHTGFKGSWLCLALEHLGANVIGLSLDPPTKPNLFSLLGLKEIVEDNRVDIRDRKKLTKTFLDAQPEIVFHLAAQPLVRYSYQNPIETYEVNFIGTLNVLEAIREVKTVRSAVIITTDKCYENTKKNKGYTEDDPMGGFDPYSSSKGAAELLISSYRNSFFSDLDFKNHKTAIASARAGNVIGGGDWAQDRLVPDIMESILTGKEIVLRNPTQVRPWQHVLEPTFAYLKLAEYLRKENVKFTGGWNFGPDSKEEKTVEWITSTLLNKWGTKQEWTTDEGNSPHEAYYLKLDCSKASEKLNWRPILSASETLDYIVQWYKEYKEDKSIRQITKEQISNYLDKLENNSYE